MSVAVSSEIKQNFKYYIYLAPCNVRLRNDAWAKRRLGKHFQVKNDNVKISLDQTT